MSTVAPAPNASAADRVFERVNGSPFNASQNPLTEEQKKLARTLGPSEKKSNATKTLAERFLNLHVKADAHITKKHGEKSAASFRAWNQVGRIRESNMIQAWDNEEFKVLGKDGVSFEALNDIVVHGLDHRYKRGTRLAEGLKAAKRGKDMNLKEHVVMGIGQSQYGRYLDDAVRLGTLETCGMVDVAPILNLFGRVQVDCGQTHLASDLVPMHVWKELHPMAENEPTPFFGVGDPIETELPKRHKIKFAYAIKREAYCRGLDSYLRMVMMQGAKQIDRYWAPHIIQNAFGMYANPADNPWRYSLNGNKYANEYPEGAVGFENQFPYTNLVYNDQDISRGDDAIFVLIEQLMRAQVDLRNGDPVECAQGSMDIISTGFVQLENIRSGLGAVTVSVALGGAGNPVAETTRSSRSRWNTSGIVDNVWIERYLTEFMKEIAPYSGWTAAQRRQALDRTFIAGNLRAAMVIQDEWGQEEFDMPTEWTSFDREDVWGRKFMRKSGIATLQPNARFVVRGLPDGIAAPAAPTAP